MAVPVKLTAAFPVEIDTVHRTYRGVKFNEFIDAQPYATVQREAVDAAKQWIRHMALQGYELMGNETEIEMWGPYRPKTKLYRSFGEERSATSFTRDENPFPDGKAKMLLRGRFLARRQYAVEHG